MKIWVDVPRLHAGEPCVIVADGDDRSLHASVEVLGPCRIGRDDDQGNPRVVVDTGDSPLRCS